MVPAMPSSTRFPTRAGWEASRQTLHLYSKVVGAVSRVHAEFHPKWWHVGLNVHPDGLATDPMVLPQGGSFRLELDLRRHWIILSSSAADERRFDMTTGLTGTEMGDRVLGAVADLDLTGDYARERFESDEPRDYDPAAVGELLTALVAADGILKRHRNTLPGEVGPVQLWSHGFDLSFEWFGTRMVTHEEKGDVQEIPSQINFGFYPGEPTYFYANPWPFAADELVDHPLPGGARWHDEDWQGTILPYADVAGDPEAAARLLAYYGEVFRVASPTLLV